jgi:phage terminase small subunit
MTPKQLAFAAHYALDHNGAAAGVRAGYARRSARQMASELLAKPDVRALVAEHEEAAAKRLAVTKERVIAELEAAIDIARQNADPWR